MNKLCGLIVALLLVTFPAFAPAQVDVNKTQERNAFVGKWKFDSKKSSGSDSQHKDEMLVIAYEDPRLTIERTLTLKKETKSATMVLFADKRGEKNNPFPFSPHSGAQLDHRMAGQHSCPLIQRGNAIVQGGETWRHFKNEGKLRTQRRRQYFSRDNQSFTRFARQHS